MLLENNYTVLLLARMKNDELNKKAEINRLREESSRDAINRAATEKQEKKIIKKKAIITYILEGTGKALITTGNKLLDIA